MKPRNAASRCMKMDPLLLDSTFIGELQELQDLLNLNPDDKVTLTAVLKAFICADSDNESCWMNSCVDCLDRKESLRQTMIKMFQDLDTQTISYIQWDKEDGGNAVFKIASTVSQEELCEDFVNRIYKLKKHDSAWPDRPNCLISQTEHWTLLTLPQFLHQTCLLFTFLRKIYITIVLVECLTLLIYNYRIFLLTVF